jgi:hypothetical protein
MNGLGKTGLWTCISRLCPDRLAVSALKRSHYRSGIEHAFSAVGWFRVSTPPTEPVRCVLAQQVANNKGSSPGRQLGRSPPLQQGA